MKKIGVVVLVTTLASSLFAHDLWVWGTQDKKLNVDMIYGHHFPAPEKIADERVSLFEPVKVIGEKETLSLKQVGEEAYHYEGDKLSKGAYLLNAYYKATPWIKTANGEWAMGKTRKDAKDVELCLIATMQGKALISVDGGDGKIISKTLDRGLEITPMFDSLKDIKEGKLLKFKLTLNGKAVKQAEVFGSYGGYASNDMASAAFAKTDLNGEFEFRPLKKGLWYLKSVVKNPTNDKDCETYQDKTTLIFEVK
ncbi:DUF4198 domain-containing protein [Campylobacter blaseri]|uniref:Nickel transporter n=1 Tax=Campylobacter blaseri TaxID=2042961 RepID=A0A2P8QZ08_9BACT|nr:DUF4198 domain-containing protein [Campylobacter blaseri]PSM51479.1 hypothetical protein CQ405_07895 [Campylobacter blaseri]PSM52928.1 hypothetical protein CRN67_07900 [Campylobacter blaseri]QKF86513.1 DUF4198 domain-containing protein [Campylobacter blaseri]